MFLFRLNSDQQSIFCHAALHLIAADGKLQGREQEIKDEILREIAPSDYPDELEDLTSLVLGVGHAFQGEGRKIFLLELAGVATADLELHPEERALLQRFGDELGLAEKLPELIELAEQAHQLHDRLRLAVRDD